MVRSTRSEANRSRWYGSVPITITLATAIGLLVLVTVGVVFGVGVWIAQKNTFDLLRANARQANAADVNLIEQHLRPAEHQAQFLANQIARGELDPGNKEQFGQVLMGALAAARQIEAVMIVDESMIGIVAARERDNVVVDAIDLSTEPVISEHMKDVSLGPECGPPVWREVSQRTYLNRVHPVRRDKEHIGTIIAVTSVRGLSRFMSEQGLETPGNRFILYGRDHTCSPIVGWGLLSGK